MFLNNNIEKSTSRRVTFFFPILTSLVNGFWKRVFVRKLETKKAVEKSQHVLEVWAGLRV